MTDRFFTNALAAAAAATGTQRIPVDIVAGGSECITPAQIVTYATPTIVAAALAAIAAARGATDKYSADASAAGFTATGAQVAGVTDTVVLDLTGALGAGANLQMPTAAALVAAIPAAFIGQTYLLRVLNNSAGAFAWTVTTNTGITLAGTVTVAQSTFRDFLVSLTSLTAVSVQNVGSGGI